MKLHSHIRMALCALPLLALAAPLSAIAPSSGVVDGDATTNGPQPKVSERQAVELGLNRVPQGTVQTARLEEQNGHQVWFLDIAGYNGRSRQEILVDADTGRVISSHARSLVGPSSPQSSRETG